MGKRSQRGQGSQPDGFSFGESAGGDLAAAFARIEKQRKERGAKEAAEAGGSTSSDDSTTKPSASPEIKLDTSVSASDDDKKKGEATQLDKPEITPRAKKALELLLVEEPDDQSIKKDGVTNAGVKDTRPMTPELERTLRSLLFNEGESSSSSKTEADPNAKLPDSPEVDSVASTKPTDIKKDTRPMTPELERTLRSLLFNEGEPGFTSNSDVEGEEDEGEDEVVEAEEEQKILNAKEARKKRVDDFKDVEKEMAERIKDKVRPAVEQVAIQAKAASSPEVFAADFPGEDGRALVIIKGKNDEYKSLGQALGVASINKDGEKYAYEEDVRLVFGSAIRADLQKREVVIPRNLSKRDLPFVAREILRVVNLDRKEKKQVQEKTGKKGPWVWVDDYVETDLSRRFADEAKKEKKYLEKLAAIRKDHRHRPLATLRNEYKTIEGKYLASKSESERTLEIPLADAATRFAAEIGHGLFDDWNGTGGFEKERKRRLEAEQGQFVFQYDNDSNGILTGEYSLDLPNGPRGLDHWTDAVPVFAAARRVWFGDRGEKTDLFRRFWRVHGEQILEDIRFRNLVLHHHEDEQDSELRELLKSNDWLKKDLPVELGKRTLKGVGGLAFVGMALPYFAFEWVEDLVDDWVEGATNWLFRKTSWPWLQSKDKGKEIRLRKKKELQSRVEALLREKNKGK